ncbi:unnamed protein product [[Candida] boidinii]|nr:unnamed protein product [[Candida] boidinii]
MSDKSTTNTQIPDSSSSIDKGKEKIIDDNEKLNENLKNLKIDSNIPLNDTEDTIHKNDISKDSNDSKDLNDSNEIENKDVDETINDKNKENEQDPSIEQPHQPFFKPISLPKPPENNTNDVPSRTLWMGDIESWWDEEFVSQIWSKLNKKVSVKVIKPKQGLLMHKLAAAAASNEVPNSSIFNHSGYCFIEFDSNEDATEALSLNGTIIQNTNNKLFRLNWASAATLNTQVDQSPEYSLFVGDLSPGTTEAHLLAFFQNYFDTVKTVRVMTDPATGLSRCFGFVRFGNEDDRKRALLEVNGRWLGGRPIRVALATPKHQNNNGNNNNNNNNHNHHHHRYNNNSNSINNNGGYDLMMNGVGVSSNADVGSNGGQQYIHHNRHYRNNNDNGINNNNNNINNNNGRLNHHQVQQNVAVRQAQAAHQAAMTAAAVAAGMIDPNTLDPQAQAAAAQAAAAAAASGMFIAPPPGVGGVPPQMPGVGVGVGGPHAPVQVA